MFGETRSRFPWVGTLGLLLLAAGATAIGWTRPSLLERASLLMAGGNPLAEPFAEVRRDQVYPESPLVVALSLEAGFVKVDREVALAFADDIARDLGFWLLETTGGRDLDEAERLLWQTDGDPDRLAVAWALALQRRNLYNRDSRRLSDSPPPFREDPMYAHSDEFVLLFAHVAWRLDLAAELVRSPVHHFVVMREPGGTRARGVEPTCFRRVDALGKLAPSEEPSVGRRLTFGTDHYPSGSGGIVNKKPLPQGAYQPVSAAELTGDLLVRLAVRHGAAVETLEQQLEAAPTASVAEAVMRIRLARGIAAWESKDLATVAAEAERLAALRVTHGELLGHAPDERALEAAIAFDGGERERGFDAIHAVLRHHEPEGAAEHARTDAHAMAMWLELEQGLATPEDWNRRIVPLLNRHRDDPAQIQRLCGIGRKVLADTKQTVEELVPECR